jgi:hypothetical protein
MLIFFLFYECIKSARTILSTLYHVMHMNEKIILCIGHAMRLKNSPHLLKNIKVHFSLCPSPVIEMYVCRNEKGGGWGNEGGIGEGGGAERGGTREGPAWEKCENSRRQKAPGIIYTG